MSLHKCKLIVFLEGILASYVIIDDVLYDFQSPISAVDGCFKIFISLHAAYPEGSYPVWLFIQKYIYNIDTDWDKHFSSVDTLISEL